MSLSGQEVSAEEHERWFAHTLDPSRCFHLVGEVAGGSSEVTRVGVVRFEREDSGWWLVSINLNPTERGKGYATRFLGEAIAYFAASQPQGGSVLRAVILEGNDRSVAVFRHNAFRLDTESDGVLTMARELS